MEKPLCKLCREKHWPRDPHVFPNLEEDKKTVVKMMEDSIKDKPKSKTERMKLAKAAFDRVAYQREYMRKRRARKNA